MIKNTNPPGGSFDLLTKHEQALFKNKTQKTVFFPSPEQCAPGGVSSWSILLKEILYIKTREADNHAYVMSISWRFTNRQGRILNPVDLKYLRKYLKTIDNSIGLLWLLLNGDSRVLNSQKLYQYLSNNNYHECCSLMETNNQPKRYLIRVVCR